MRDAPDTDRASTIRQVTVVRKRAATSRKSPLWMPGGMSRIATLTKCAPPSCAMLTKAPLGTARTAIGVQPLASHTWIAGRLAASVARWVAAISVAASGSSR